MLLAVRPTVRLLAQARLLQGDFASDWQFMGRCRLILAGIRYAHGQAGR
jgi:hypothetical protein